MLVHQPYESFRTSFEAFVAAAADDPDVIAMKTAVYRTSDDSTLVSALIDCAEDGQAGGLPRRAEGALRRAPQHRVVARAGAGGGSRRPRLPGHEDPRQDDARRPPRGGGLRRYVHIGTGNYHAATARLYEDVGIFTADEEIAADVADVFNYVTGLRPPAAVPQAARGAVRDAHAADRGDPQRSPRPPRPARPARIRLKLNNLVDPRIIDELYAALGAGATVEICARSICMLRPGVEGLSENVSVRSILGRFLEHSRIYSFEAGDDDHDVHRQRRHDAAQPRPARRGARARRERALPPGAAGGARQRLRRRRPSLGAGERRLVVPRRAEKAGKRVDHQAAMMRRAQLRARRQTDGGSARGRRSRPDTAALGLPVRVAGQDELDARCGHRRRARTRPACWSRTSPARVRSCPSPRSASTCASAPRSSEPGRSSAEKIAAAADTCSAYARRIAELDVERATVIVTAPGRQGAAAPELTAALAEATSLPVRVLTAESEGRLAYDGAVARAVGDLPEVVAVVDVGGGSTELVVGTPLLGAAWVRSADVGSLRLTRAHLTDDPPSAAQVRAARRRRGRALAGMSPPRPASRSRSAAAPAR